MLFFLFLNKATVTLVSATRGCSASFKSKKRQVRITLLVVAFFLSGFNFFFTFLFRSVFYTQKSWRESDQMSIHIDTYFWLMVVFCVCMCVGCQHFLLGSFLEKTEVGIQVPEHARSFCWFITFFKFHLNI